MNKYLLPAAVLSAALLPAQQPKEAAGERGLVEAKAAYTALVAEYDAASAAYTAAMRALVQTDAYKKARADRDSKALSELRKSVTPVDRAGFVAKFQAGAEQYAGEGAIDYLVWLALNSRDNTATVAAVEALLDDHVNSAKLLPLAEGMRATARPLGDAEWRKACARIAEDSPHATVRAWAMYWPAYMTINGRGSSDEAKAEAQEALDTAEALAQGTDLADRIAAPRFQRENLQIGMEVPDIEGEDLDGVAFKLSDYRGKVVVLDFWGDW